MKRACVIGASQGLGLHLAVRLHEIGWTVTGTGRRLIEDVSFPVGIDYIQIDLSSADALNILFKYLKTTNPDLIVHNAVTYGKSDTDIPQLSDIEMVFRVNALLPYQLFHDYLSSIASDTRCSCIIINSDSIYHANQHSGIYAASKAALRVLTSALADMCRPLNASVSTLLLGPLPDPKKMSDLRNIAERRHMPEEEVIRTFLRKSNPSLVLNSFIDFEACFQSVRYIANLGHVANGMVCKLDGGSSGSLV